MIAEPDRLRLSPAALGRVTFLDTLDPLPLTDPTSAARFLGVKRHTLACYRSLGEGPPYYKFGRWVRYAWADLGQWGRIESVDAVLAFPSAEFPGSNALLLVDTPTAARFLTLTRFCLYNYRAEGGGPRFSRFGRRIHYLVSDLCDWAHQQRRIAGSLQHTGTLDHDLSKKV